MPRITITVPDQNAQPYRFDLDCQVVTMGRGSDNDIVIESNSVSVHHAEMHRIIGGYELRDIGSTNGIMLNEAHHQWIPLLNGLNVKVGDATFDFLLTEAECDALALEKKAEQTAPLLKPAASAFDDVPLPRYATYEPDEPSSNGFWTFSLALILITVAFFIGLHLRHQKETGGSLIDSIRNKAANLPAASES